VGSLGVRWIFLPKSNILGAVERLVKLIELAMALAWNQFKDSQYYE
jgi:hypothetical protein